MSTNFPTSLDSLTNPTSTDRVDTVDHAAQHANANDAIEALQAKVGVDSSAVTSSHDYKLSGVTGSDKAASIAGSEILTNKTLTSPTINGGTQAGNISDTSARTVTGTIDAGDATSLEIPNSVSPTVNADGEIAVDTTVADFSHGIIKFYGGEEQGVVSMPIAQFTSPVDGDIVQYNATTDEFELNQLDTTGTTCLTDIPKPVVPWAAADTPITISTNTTQRFYQFYLPFSITVNKISIKAFQSNVTGTFDLTIYSEDGQAQEIAVTTASVSSGGIITTAVSSVTLNAGMHWFAINPNSTASADFYTYTSVANGAFINTTANMGTDISSEPVLTGTTTITADTPATTFTPSSLTETTLSSVGIMFRLDN